MIKKQITKTNTFSLAPVSYIFARTYRGWVKEQKLYEKCDQKTNLLASNAGKKG
jgi:hypothetical protein